MITKITVADAAGKVIRTLNTNGQPGVNRVLWDLRHDPPAAPPVAREFQWGPGAGPHKR